MRPYDTRDRLWDEMAVQFGPGGNPFRNTPVSPLRFRPTDPAKGLRSVFVVPVDLGHIEIPVGGEVIAPGPGPIRPGRAVPSTASTVSFCDLIPIRPYSPRSKKTALTGASDAGVSTHLPSGLWTTGSSLARAVKTFGALPFASIALTFQCPGLRKHPGVGRNDLLSTAARYGLCPLVNPASWLSPPSSVLIAGRV